MLKWLKSKLSKRPEGMPASVKEYWYCGSWYMYRSDERQAGREARSDHIVWPVEGKFLFNFFKCDILQHGNKDGLVDGLIPAYRSGNLVGLYKVVSCRYRTTSFYDGSMWDDGYNVDLEFVKAVPVVQVPSLCTPETAEVSV